MKFVLVAVRFDQIPPNSFQQHCYKLHRNKKEATPRVNYPPSSWQSCKHMLFEVSKVPVWIRALHNCVSSELCMYGIHRKSSFASHIIPIRYLQDSKKRQRKFCSQGHEDRHGICKPVSSSCCCLETWNIATLPVLCGLWWENLKFDTPSPHERFLSTSSAPHHSHIASRRRHYGDFWPSIIIHMHAGTFSHLSHHPSLPACTRFRRTMDLKYAQVRI